MKFGRDLHRNQVPEWASSYIDYKGLKKIVKAASETARKEQETDPAELFAALDRNLEEVDCFYNKKLSQAQHRLDLLHSRYGSDPNALSLDEDEIEDGLEALLELQTQLRNVQWFGEINRRGFVKITKKWDKKVPGIVAQDTYLTANVDPKPFAKNESLSKLLADVNRWLSALGNARELDSPPANGSPRAFGQASSKWMADLSRDQLISLQQAVKKDDTEALNGFYSSTKNFSRAATQNILLNLLQRAISSRSKASVTWLLKHTQSLEELEDINGRNCLHRLVIHIGRINSTSCDGEDGDSVVALGTSVRYLHFQPGTEISGSASSSEAEQPATSTKEHQAFQILVHLLDSLNAEQRGSLTAKDSYGRIPLHYAAQYGLVLVSHMVIVKMTEWGQLDTKNGIDAPEWQDRDGYAPLHLSVIGGHPQTTKTLLNGDDSATRAVVKQNISQSGAVLALATKANFKTIVQILVDAGVDINWTDKTGETALHVAARFGHDDCLKIILKGTDLQKADLEIAEASYAWTPLHIAAMSGFADTVIELVGAGADVRKSDSSGWTAQEHAAFRGYMDIAKHLAAKIGSAVEAPGSTQSKNGKLDASPHPKIGNHGVGTATKHLNLAESFGQRYLTEDALILVSLGSLDMRKNIEPVSLDNVPPVEPSPLQHDAALSIVLSAIGAEGEPIAINLPVSENISTEPILFTTKDASKVKLLFDIVPTNSRNEKTKLGRAAALLSSVKANIGTDRMNLQGDLCVPIISSDLEVIGAVNFNFSVITAFHHPMMNIRSHQTDWKSPSSTRLIGHRGLGKNRTTSQSLQLGENTLESFVAAADLGAQYVEFDVQLTKDHVPVIYHDFLVSETGIDAPVHTLTLEQFLHINPDHSRTNGAHSTTPAAPPNSEDTVNLPLRKHGDGPRRSYSVGFAGDSHLKMNERMKHTLDFKAKGYKANSRGNFIQAPFATLEDLLRKLPGHIGFNIEMKYPMLHESEEQMMDPYAVELNSFVDTVLSKVFELGRDRNIIFSSFNPDVCLSLSLKQPSIPVLFLTDAGVSPVGDIRASSLQKAVQFATRWNLLGIVSAAEPFINSPKLIRVVKGSGLVCVSYGTLNNDNAMVQRQVGEGIDAVIVDSVLAIRKGLTNASVES